MKKGVYSYLSAFMVFLFITIYAFDEGELEAIILIPTNFLPIIFFIIPLVGMIFGLIDKNKYKNTGGFNTIISLINALIFLALVFFLAMFNGFSNN